MAILIALVAAPFFEWFRCFTQVVPFCVVNRSREHRPFHQGGIIHTGR